MGVQVSIAQCCLLLLLLRRGATLPRFFDRVPTTISPATSSVCGICSLLVGLSRLPRPFGGPPEGEQGGGDAQLHVDCSSDGFRWQTPDG
jgi:hypothetical protein